MAGDSDGGARDLYERSGGTTTQIAGSGAAGSQFAGVSADGTHLYFTTTEGLAAGDTDAAGWTSTTAPARRRT